MMGQICQDNPQNILKIKELSKKYFKEKNELEYSVKKVPAVDNANYTTEHRKGQHLLNEERYEIEVRLKDG